MIILIDPNLGVQSDDPFTTGMVYMPLSLAYGGASLRAAMEIPIHAGTIFDMGLSDDSFDVVRAEPSVTRTNRNV